mgnify:CR=1 FL=1
MTNILNINNRRFTFISSAASICLVLFFFFLFLSSSVFAAFPIAGVGGFVIEASRITGNNLQITTELGSTELHENWGQARIDLGQANITGLKLTKKVNLNGVLSQYGIKDMDIVITPASGSTVTGNNLRLGVTGLTASSSDFHNLRADERSSSRPIDRLRIRANQLTLNNPKLNVHSMAAGNITIPGLKVKFIFNKHDGTTNGDFYSIKLSKK